jgi:hypothetical protein
MNDRTKVLYGTLALTLVATVWLSTVEDSDAELVAPRVAPSADEARRDAGATSRPVQQSVPVRESPPQSSTLLLPQARKPFPKEGADFAAPLSFRPVLPPPAPEAARAPVAPPLPFRFIGAIEEGALRRAFIMDGTQLHIVGPGDLVDGRYRVERVEPGFIEFTYLPLGRRQTLPSPST